MAGADARIVLGRYCDRHGAAEAVAGEGDMAGLSWEERSGPPVVASMD
jgi:hypothetical protein